MGESRPLLSEASTRPRLGREEFTNRLKQAAQHVNENYEVAALCREFPGRLDELVELKGDKLRK